MNTIAELIIITRYRNRRQIPPTNPPPPLPTTKTNQNARQNQNGRAGEGGEIKLASATDGKVLCETMEELGLGECSSEQPLQWSPPPPVCCALLSSHSAAGVERMCGCLHVWMCVCVHGCMGGCLPVYHHLYVSIQELPCRPHMQFHTQMAQKLLCLGHAESQRYCLAHQYLCLSVCLSALPSIFQDLLLLLSNYSSVDYSSVILV